MKSLREMAKIRKAKDQAERLASLKAQRMTLAKRAGRGATTQQSQQAVFGFVEQDEDGRMVERRRDPSDNELYTFESFVEVYEEKAKELWHTAGLMMAEAKKQESAYNRVGSDEGQDSRLAGLDVDFRAGASGVPGGDDSVEGLDAALRHELVSKTEFDLAAEQLVNKFEQLIVSDNFATFLAKFTTQMMSDAKPEQVQELISSMTRSQSAQSKQKKLRGKLGKKALRKDSASDTQGRMKRGGFIEDMGEFL